VEDLEQPLLPVRDPRARGGVRSKPAQDDRACGGVTPLFLETARQDAPRRRLVDGIGGGEMARGYGDEVRLEGAVNTRNSFQRLPRAFGRLEHAHEGDDAIVRRLGLLCRRAQLRQSPAPRVGVLRTIPHVPAKEQLGGQLRSEGDPAAEHAHDALLGVPVVANASGGTADGQVPGQPFGAQSTWERWVLFTSRSISSSVKPASLRASLAIEIGTTSWWPSCRVPPRLKRSSIVSWNSMARRRRSASPRVSSLSQREPIRTWVISS